jgi:hypothetical protein
MSCGGDVARDQVRHDRQILRAVGGADPTWRRDRSNAIPPHQSFDPAAAGATSLRPQGGMDPGTAVALAAVVMDLPDLGKEGGIGGCTCAHRGSRQA